MRFRFFQDVIGKDAGNGAVCIGTLIFSEENMENVVRGCL